MNIKSTLFFSTALFIMSEYAMAGTPLGAQLGSDLGQALGGVLGIHYQ